MVKKLEIEAVLFILVGAFVGLFLIAYIKSKPVQINSFASFTPAQQLGITVSSLQKSNQSAVTQSPSTKATQSPTQVPTQAPPAVVVSGPTQTSATSQISSDGTQSVTIQTVQNKLGPQTDNILTANSTTPVWSKTLSPGESLSIPFNTWSPDNNYFFLLDNSGSAQKILVFQANGSPFTSGQSYLDLTQAFSNYGSSDTFDQASGWAADNLIVILTTAPDGSEGTSYWFGVPDSSITPLATMF
jgi:hypothetical protein